MTTPSVATDFQELLDSIQKIINDLPKNNPNKVEENLATIKEHIQKQDINQEKKESLFKKAVSYYIEKSDPGMFEPILDKIESAKTSLTNEDKTFFWIQY